MKPPSSKLNFRKRKVTAKVQNNNRTSPRAKRLKVNNVAATESWSVDEPDVTENRDYIDTLGACGNIINKLNHDCLAKIIMYLPAIERFEMEKVCQKWKEATKMSWHNVKKITINSRIMQNEKKMILKNACPFLTHLSITVSHPWLYDIIKNKCRNVINLNIRFSPSFGDKKYPYKKFLRVITSMSKLKYLKVNMNAWNDSNAHLATGIFHRLPDNMEEIHILVELIFSEKKKSIVDLPSRFNNLRGFSLQRFHLTEATIQLISLNGKTLVHLDLARCTFPPGASSIFSKLNKLEHLNLHSVHNLDIGTITKIARNCQELKYLQFLIMHDHWEVKKIPYNLFHDLKYLNNLEHLHIFLEYDLDIFERAADAGENILSNTGKSWKNLKYLNLGEDCYFSKSTKAELTKFKKLEYLYLPFGTSIDSKFLIDIARNCLELKILKGNFKKAITTSALEKLGNLKKLKKLKLHGLDNLTDDLFNKIVSNFKDLRELEIKECKKLTGASLRQVSKLKHLKRLHVSYVNDEDSDA